MLKKKEDEKSTGKNRNKREIVGFVLKVNWTSLLG